MSADSRAFRMFHKADFVAGSGDKPVKTSFFAGLMANPLSRDRKLHNRSMQEVRVCLHRGVTMLHPAVVRKPRTVYSRRYKNYARLDWLRIPGVHSGRTMET
jgi:hypothetical protein